MKSRVMVGNVLKVKLHNGLTALVLPDKKSDVASVIHWVKVGYFNESDDVLGISHFLEHLFFKGSKTRKMEEITDEIKGLGGYINAGTIYDHTYYYSVLPAPNIHRAIEVISDILLHPNFSDEEIESEKGVITQEIKRKLDSPDQMGFEKLIEMAFNKHRIRRFRMGYEKDIKKLGRKEIEKYYSNFYKPNNSIIAVVGNFDPKKVVETIKKFYGDWKKGKMPQDKSPSEAKQKRPKYRKLTGDIMQSYLKLGFHIPNVTREGFYPANFAAALLGKGRSSRLFKRLKEELSLVDGIGTSIYADKDIGYLMIEATLKEDKFQNAESEIAAEVARLMTQPPSGDEIQKVRNIIETNYFADKEDVLGQAYNLAYFESLGDYKLANEFLLKSVSVKKDEIIESAKGIFTLNNMSLLEYSQGKGDKKKKKDTFKIKEDLLKKLKAYLPEEGYLPKTRIEKIAESEFPFDWLGKHKSGKIEISRVPGRMTLISKKNTGIPLISTAIYLPGGRLDENETNCGITNLVLRSLLKGTKSMNSSAIAEKLESLGCSVRLEATADNFGYAFSVLNKNFKEAFDIIREVLTEPIFKEAEIEKEKKSMKASILSRKDDMFRYPIDLCYKALFGIHPYGLPRFGTEKSLNDINRNDVVKWYESFFDWTKMTACSVGEVLDDTRNIFIKQFEHVKKQNSKTAKILPLVINRGIKEVSERRRKNQTAFSIGFQTPGMTNDDYYPLEVLQNLLSGMGGRLYMQVREKAGLAYTVTGFNISLLRTGAFVIYAATSPKNEAKAKDIILKEIENVKKSKISAKEIKRAKNYTIGSNSISLQTNLAQVYEYLRYYFMKRDLDEIDEFNSKISAVTEEDLKRVLNKYFNSDNYAIGVVRGV